LSIVGRHIYDIRVAHAGLEENDVRKCAQDQEDCGQRATSKQFWIAWIGSDFCKDLQKRNSAPFLRHNRSASLKTGMMEVGRISAASCGSQLPDVACLARRAKSSSGGSSGDDFDSGAHGIRRNPGVVSKIAPANRSGRESSNYPSPKPPHPVIYPVYSHLRAIGSDN
jgi:hypothetical protein